MTSRDAINKLKIMAYMNIINYRSTKRNEYLEKAIRATKDALYIHRQPRNIEYV